MGNNSIGKPRPALATNGKSFHHWRTEKEKWLARKNQLEAETMAERLVDVEEFSRRWDQIFIRLKQTVKQSGIPEQLQAQLLGELEKVLRDE